MGVPSFPSSCSFFFLHQKFFFGSLPLYQFPHFSSSSSSHGSDIRSKVSLLHLCVCVIPLLVPYTSKSRCLFQSLVSKKKVFTIVWLFGRRSMLMKHIAIFSSENLKPANPITCIDIATPIRSRFMTAYKMCAFAIACGYVRQG